MKNNFHRLRNQSVRILDDNHLEIGNTNSRYKFSLGARGFVNNWNSHGPAHHCAVGVGHIGSKIKKLGALLNMDVVQVC